MKRFSILMSCAAMAGLAACSGAADDANDTDGDTELEVATTDGEAIALANAIEPADFADLQLGAKIVGPQGEEVTGALSNAAGNFADIRSYVACPRVMDSCDPKTAPPGTIYTYVHVVYPGEDNDDDTGSGTGNTSSDIERATAFRMIQPAHGFTGVVGYSKAEAAGAMGEGGQVVVNCIDGKLEWTLDAGDGGDQWEQAEPVTFFWQSTVPPAGPSNVYQIAANYSEATGPGPYPAPSNEPIAACG